MSTHFEGLGNVWLTFFNSPENQLPDVIAQVLSQGGTRECWQRSDKGKEYAIMAWPQESPVRFGVTLYAKTGEPHRPATAYPLLEGAPIDMTVEDIHPWLNETEGTVAACCNEGANPLWFYSPFLFRDRENLTPGVRHTFVVAGLALGVRRALLDDLTISSGPQYEAFAKEWLETHPGATPQEVPQLKVPLSGARILNPDNYIGTYQLRVPVTSVKEYALGSDVLYMMIVEFGLNTPNPLRFPLYATSRVCGKYIPKAGDEIDAMIWLQGRIID